MSIDAKKIIFRRLVREYEFLVEDLRDIEQANTEIKDSFMKSLNEIDQEGILQTDEIDNMADGWAKSVKEQEDLEKESNKHPDFKGLFRKVVVKCHPDKLDSNMPRGITFDPNVGWLYGTFKYKEAMFHKILADINGQLFEYHIISCDADSKPSYDEVKQTYFNRPYDAPPFTLREYWVPMARPVKLLEPGDPFIRTYNLNDLHLYRSYE